MKIRFAGLSVMLMMIPILFQNCIVTETDMRSYSSNSKSDRTQIAGGNGDSYEGKLEVSAPEVQSAGVPVAVSVKGGVPPYTMSSSSDSGEFISISEGNYYFQVASSEPAGVVEIVATDSVGNSALAEIRILGINNWYFQAPGGVAFLSEGKTAVIDEAIEELVVLGSDGKYLNRQQLPFDFGSVAQKSKNILLLASSNQFYTFDLEKDLLSDGPRAKADCQEVDRIHSVSEFIFHSCSGEKALYATHEDETLSFTVIPSGITLPQWSQLIGGFPLGNDTELLLVYSDGQFIHTTLDGVVLRNWKIQGISDGEIRSLDFTDSDVLSGNEIVLLSRFKRHIYIYDDHGQRLKRLGARGTRDGEFAAVSDLSVLDGTKIVVTDPVFSKISYFDANGFSHSYGSNSSQQGVFNEPWDVRFGPDGSLHVLEKINARIQSFSGSGKLLGNLDSKDPESGLSAWWSSERFHLSDSGRFVLSNRARFLIHSIDPESRQSRNLGEGTQGSGDHQFSQAGAAVELSDGRILVADTNNDRVQVFNARDQFVQSLQIPEGFETKLRIPRDIEIHPLTGQIFVLHENETEMAVFDSELNFQGFVPGQGQARFSHPVNFSFGPNGDIFLVDQSRHRVVRMSDKGVFSRVYETPVGLKQPVQNPRGAAVSPDGSTLAIADTGNDRILLLPLK